MNRKLKTAELGRVSPIEFEVLEKHPVIFMLENVRSAHNVGAFFRTVDALAGQELWLCGITPIPPNKDIRKTAIGATETVQWRQFENANSAIQKARDLGYEIIAIEQTENKSLLGQWSWPATSGVVLVFGNEVDGVDQRVIDDSDQVIEIEQFGTKHSFNVSVAGGIVGWEVVRQYLLRQY